VPQQRTAAHRPDAGELVEDRAPRLRVAPLPVETERDRCASSRIRCSSCSPRRESRPRTTAPRARGRKPFSPPWRGR
jgi:hypothetical protein